MKDFAALLETLVVTPSRNAKIAAMARYFETTPDPDRGFALAAITRDLTLTNLKAGALRGLAMERVDPELFLMSYDYVGDLAETISLIWPAGEAGSGAPELPCVSAFVETVETIPKSRLAAHVAGLMDAATPSQRWAMIKLATGGLRVGVSARLAKTALAAYSGQELAEIEKIWHGLDIPYTDLFAWLDGQAPAPKIRQGQTFHPMMLSNPIDEERDFERLDAAAYQAEWKWDGIRVQLVFDGDTRRMFSRTGDDISAAFPDVTEALQGRAVLDGELLVGNDFMPMPFNRLQQRLNRKTPAKSHLRDCPAFVRVYDMLFDGTEDIRDLPLARRRQRLEAWIASHGGGRLDISEILPFGDWSDLARLRTEGAEIHGHEGLMIKQRNSAYVAGRPKGPWFKWKRDPRLIDTVMIRSAAMAGAVHSIPISPSASGAGTKSCLWAKPIRVSPMTSFANSTNGSGPTPPTVSVRSARSRNSLSSSWPSTARMTARATNPESRCGFPGSAGSDGTSRRARRTISKRCAR